MFGGSGNEPQKPSLWMHRCIRPIGAKSYENMSNFKILTYLVYEL